MITKQIYQNFNSESRLQTGLELEWIDIGTGALPDQAKDIITQHEDAWRKSLENLKTRSAFALEHSENESKIKATRKLLVEIIYEFRKLEQSAEADEIITALLNQYLENSGWPLRFTRSRPVPPRNRRPVQHWNSSGWLMYPRRTQQRMAHLCKSAKRSPISAPCSTNSTRCIKPEPIQFWLTSESSYTPGKTK